MYIYIYIHMAVPWFRQLVAYLSTRRPGFNLGSVCLGFVVHGGSWTRLRPSTSGFPHQCHPTSAPYQSSAYCSYQNDRWAMTGNIRKSFFENVRAIGGKRFSLYIPYRCNVLLDKDGGQLDRSCEK